MARPGLAWHDPLVRKADITTDLVTRLIASQFPQWAGLPVRPVDVDGWDNATFRLGEELSVRLPSAEDYVGAIAKEQRWLPVLARQLPLPIPQPVGVGEPGCGFSRPWSVYRWIDGDPVTEETLTDPVRFAADLADFLGALYEVDPAGGPPPGQHNFWRGGPLDVYGGQVRDDLRALRGHIDTKLAGEVWQAALATPLPEKPVWFHGDAQPGNLLLTGGRLSAVIDFGTSGIGDPSCDTTIAWTFLSGEASRVFAQRLPVDSATWIRGRGWAIWKAMLVLGMSLKSGDTQDAAFSKDVIGKILADHLASQ